MIRGVILDLGPFVPTPVPPPTAAVDFHPHTCTCCLGGGYFLAPILTQASSNQDFVVSYQHQVRLFSPPLILFKCLTLSYLDRALSLCRLSSVVVDQSDPTSTLLEHTTHTTYIPFYRSSHLCTFAHDHLRSSKPSHYHLLSPYLYLVHSFGCSSSPSFTWHHPGHCRNGAGSHFRSS